MILIREAPRHIQPPVQWVPGLFPGVRVTGACRWPPTSFFLDDVYGYDYTIAVPLCLHGIFVTFHLLITVTRISKIRVCWRLLYTFRVFRVRYFYTILYSVVNNLSLTASRRQSNYTFWRGSLMADWSVLRFDLAENFAFTCIPVLVNTICSIRHHSFYKIYCSGKYVTGCDHQQFTPVVTKTITKSQGGMERPKYNRKKEG